MDSANSHKRWARLTLASLLALLTAALTPSWAGAVTLGNALDFSALSLSGDVDINNVAKVGSAPIGSPGDVGGSDVTLGNNSLAGGDAIAEPGDVVAIGNYSTVVGESITGAGGSVILGLGAKSGFIDTTGTNGKLAVKADAITDVGTFDTALTSATPSLTLAAVTLAAGKKATITDSVVGGLNIIEVPSVTLGNSSTLTLSGGPADSLVLEITGDLKIGNGAKIVLTGGLSVNEVLIYVNGSVASWGNSTTVGATLLAPNSAIAAGSSAKVTGAIIAGGNVTFLENATLIFDTSLVDIPTAPLPITLGDAAGFLIVSTGGDTKVGNVTLINPTVPPAGDIGGITDTFGSNVVVNNSTIQGDVIAASNTGVGISLGNYTKVKGVSITNGSTVFKGIGAVSATDTTGTNPKLALLAGAGSDASTFSAEVASLPVDQTLAAINVPASHSQTISAGPNPVTVIDTPSITLGGSATLKIDGAAGQIVVVNVTGGALILGPGFKITLTGGITADSVVFNVEGLSGSPALVGGASSIFNGTLVASGRAGQVNTGATVNGQLIFGGDVTVGNNFKATYTPLVPIP
jgi:hypothetical protein